MSLGFNKLMMPSLFMASFVATTTPFTEFSPNLMYANSGQDGNLPMCPWNTEFSENPSTTSTSTLTVQSAYSLQRKIDSLGWEESLSAFPPRPLQSYGIKKKEAQNWIDAHICEKSKKAALTFVENTLHISQNQFENELKKSIGQFNDWLENQKSKDYILLVTSKRQKKSNRWVAELTLPHLKVLPKQVFDGGEFSDPELKDLLDYYQQNPHVNKFVFFDDAAYSCLQSGSLVCELSKIDLITECGRGRNGNRCNHVKRNKIRTQEKNFTIIAIIPFMRDPSCIFPSFNSQICFRENIAENHIRVFTSQKLKTVGDFLTQEECRLLSGCNINKIPVFFDHKLADSVSTCQSIYSRGEVLIPKACAEDEEPKPSLWNKFTGWITGIDIESTLKRLAEEKTLKKVRQFQQIFQGSTKFIDDIKPPYK